MRSAPWRRLASAWCDKGKHIVMADGVRILTIPRHNPVNALTMGGIVRDARSDRGGVPKAALELSALPPNPRMQPTGRRGARRRTGGTFQWSR